MFIGPQTSAEPNPVRGRGRPKRRRLSLANLSPSLRRLFGAAFALHGDRPALIRALGVSGTVFDRRIAALRSLGLARTVTLFDPRGRGREHHCMTLVRLHMQTPAAMESFEAWCCGDPTITSAVRTCGRFDYQLTTFHADLREADRWRRLLESRAEVGKVDQRRLETVRGHQLAGLPLLGGSPDAP